MTTAASSLAEFQARAAALDAADPLARLRDAFLPQPGVYLNGNSLGPAPRAAAAAMTEAVGQAWARDLTGGWNRRGWYDAPARVGAKLGRLVGAAEGQVLVADSTSANLFKLVAAALQARPERTVVLSEPGDFPTDLYMVEGVLGMLGGGRRLLLKPAEEIAAHLAEPEGAEVALLLLGHVHYKTAAVRDMAGLTAAAHAAGALALWDLSHSAGVLDVRLDDCGADLAVGCGYKYLNGGPGAPSFLYVAERHQASLRNPLSGWFGHAAPFGFDDAYQPAPGAARFACGTPPILSLTALEAGVDLVLQASPAQLQAKARSLGALFADAVAALAPPGALALVSPADPEARGGHLAYRHPDAFAIVQALIARGVTGDFRAPDIMRFGVSPLPLSAGQVLEAAAALATVLAERSYDHPEHRVRAAVT